MAVLKKSSAPSYHFYTPDGQPKHRMPLANEKGDRPTHVGDAKRLGLYPSVSAILQLLGKPGLEKWKGQQAVLATEKLKRTKGESDEYFVARCLEAAFKQVDDAAELGSAIHGEMDRFLAYGWEQPFSPHEKLAPYVRPALEWMRQKEIVVESPETVVVNKEHGFAGTSDAPFRWMKGAGIGVLDFKSKKTKEGVPVDYFPEQPMQIAAYGATYWGEQAMPHCWGINVYISTTEIGRVDVAIYRPQQLMQDWECFKLLCGVYRHLQQWDPRVPPDQPQPAFFSGIVKPVSGLLADAAAKEAAANAPNAAERRAALVEHGRAEALAIGQPVINLAPPPPPNMPPPPPLEPAANGAQSVPPPPPAGPAVGRTFLELLMDPSCQLELKCDGITFLNPEWSVRLSGKFQTNYSWYWHEKDNRGMVSISRDAALLEHGWKNAFFAYPADLATAEAAPPPLPRPEPPAPPAAPKKLTKAQDAKRLKELEEYEIGFGAHKGKTLAKLPNHYLDWLRGQPQLLGRNPAIKEYLERDDINQHIDRAMKRKANK